MIPVSNPHAIMLPRNYVIEKMTIYIYNKKNVNIPIVIHIYITITIRLHNLLLLAIKLKKRNTAKMLFFNIYFFVYITIHKKKQQADKIVKDI